MMKAAEEISLTLRYFAILREQSGIGEEKIVTKASTPADLYTELSKQYKFSLPVDRIRVAVNDRFDQMDVSLKNGDVIVFVPPVAGG